MKLVAIILLLISSITIKAQTEIVAMPGEYVEAENYGGKVELKRFLQQEMNYPETALTNKIQGTVELSFIVDKTNGQTSALKILKSVSKELDAEAIRLYRMLQFNPSYYLGDRVTTYSKLKIKFSVKAYKKYCKKRAYDKIEMNNIKLKRKMLVNLNAIIQHLRIIKIN